MAEWSNALDSKSSVRVSRTVGSNPTLSANMSFKIKHLALKKAPKSGLFFGALEFQVQGIPVPGDGRNAADWCSEDKFAVVLETAALNETDLVEYGRRKGLFVEQSAAWQQVCQKANARSVKRLRIKQLEKELRRKRKALAEAAALLLLSKSCRRSGAIRRTTDQQPGPPADCVAGH